MMSAQGGGTPKADAERKLRYGGCVKTQTRRGEGHNPKILQTSYVHGPFVPYHPSSSFRMTGARAVEGRIRSHIPFLRVGRAGAAANPIS